MENDRWTAYKNGIATGDKYQKRLDDYFEFCEDEELPSADVHTVEKYLIYLHAEDAYSAATLWSINSMLAPPQKIKRWQTQEEQKKTHEFTRDDINRFLRDAPTTEVTLVQKKLVIAIGIYGFQRRTEVTNLLFENFKFQPDCILVEFFRAKAKNGPKKLSKFCITDELTRGLISQYWNLFKNDEARTGRFFRKINAGMKPTLQNIGINKIGSFSVEMAKWLQLKNPEEYSSHAMRRTAATLLADSGCSVMELKAAGGWKSDSIVAQSYVAESNLAKRSVASNLNICDSGAQSIIEEDSTYGRAVHNIAQQFVFHGTNENCTFVPLWQFVS
eukprot:gene15728-21291_t